MTTSQDVTTQFLQRPEGRIAYDVQGEGPLVVCLPGIGDVRQVYRFLVPGLVGAGYRVATMDVRGHGDSDTTFTAYDDVAAAADVIALVEHLHGPGEKAVLVGNSMTAGSSVWVAAERPDLVAGLVLVGAFVRDGEVSAVQKLLLAVLLRRPWGPTAWGTFLRSLYPAQAPADLPEHLARVAASQRRPGGWAAFKATSRTTHEPARERLGAVAVPALVVMGTKDRDWPDPEAEARWIADQLNGELLLVDGAGHYPQAERPELVTPAVVALLGRAFARPTTESAERA
jgi:pimeloyl-ACP methyl ester carboxylesterase